MKTVIKLLYILTPSERRSGLILVSLIMLMALFEVVGIASIMPFIAVLTNPQLIETNTILNTIFKATSVLGVVTYEKFLFFLGVCVFILLVLSMLIRSLAIYTQINFVLMREHSISRRLVSIYLSQDYSWFLNKNSSDLGKTILSEVGTVIGNGLLPLMNILSQGSVSIALLVLLIVVDPKVAILSGVLLTLIYGSIIMLTSRKLKHLGQSSVRSNERRYAAVIEAFATVKAIKAGCFEQIFTQRFSLPSETYAKSYATARIIEQLPRYFVECLIFGTMIIIILYLMATGENIASILPILAVYALAGYRLIPAMQQIYAGLSQIRFVGPPLDSIYESINQPSKLDENDDQFTNLELQDSIVLDDVSYSYPNSSRQALMRINLSIPLASKVAFVGATGSGKTTLVDLLLGLLFPKEGKLMIDGKVLTPQISQDWKRSVGYVSQDIVLTDDSIAANIAFGVEPNDINNDDVEYASRIANLHEFVINELPQGYNTKVGERGVRLSGGQRQRIGIARALYRKPQVLILDEATSALDTLTERAIMEGISNLKQKLTIIIIAHRLITTRNCDQIYLLDCGEIKSHGTYEELMDNDSQFIKMANIL